MTTKTVRVPLAFFRDHQERDLPTPEALARRGRCVLVRRDDPAMAEFISDARHYADKSATDCEPGLRASAQATLRAIAKAVA